VLDSAFRAKEVRYLGDPDELARRTAAVKAQTG
jgi:hypothetical protein